MYFSKKSFTDTISECQIVWIQICLQRLPIYDKIKDIPADAKIVPIMAFFRAVIRSSSAIMVLYDSSLYLTAASINFRR